jgi:hypothetical protein
VGRGEKERERAWARGGARGSVCPFIEGEGKRRGCWGEGEATVTWSEWRVNGGEEGEGRRRFHARGGEGAGGAQLGRGARRLSRRATERAGVGRLEEGDAYGWGPHGGERGGGEARLVGP